MSLYSVDKLISEARRIAAEYRRATGKPLGISAEIASHDACTFLELEPHEDAIGYDAVGRIIAVVYSYCADTIRLISARKATPTERKQYEKGI